MTGKQHLFHKWPKDIQHLRQHQVSYNNGTSSHCPAVCIHWSHGMNNNTHTREYIPQCIRKYNKQQALLSTPQTEAEKSTNPNQKQMLQWQTGNTGLYVLISEMDQSSNLWCHFLFDCSDRWSSGWRSERLSCWRDSTTQTNAPLSAFHNLHHAEHQHTAKWHTAAELEPL